MTNGSERGLAAPLRIDAEYLTRTLARLVRTSSINPAFGNGTTNEREIADVVAAECERLGMRVAHYEPEPGRTSVVGTLPGSGGGRSLLLYAHVDTVGVEGMPDPFSGDVRDGRLYGRGAYDMKSGLAACFAAVEALRSAGGQLAGDLSIAAVADEEVASIGMADVLHHVRTDAAVVTEATELRLCLAHKGFCWIEVVTEGRAAHGSRFEEGIDANIRMGRVLAELDVLEQRLRGSTAHRLVGPPSLHAAVLQGGTGASTYASSCRLEIERRMIPGETVVQVVGEIQAIIDRLASADPTFRATARSLLARESFEARPDGVIATVIGDAAAAVLRRPVETIGEPYWMDAALLAAAGIDTAVIGPSGAGAHAAEEWVELASVATLAEILARTAMAYCGGTRLFAA
ncbi:MAG: M20/M25/M40 family metallo-hydrolase [Gemmatimonadaceae bacterium]